MQEQLFANKLFDDGLELLKKLISTPSTSRNEAATADLLYEYLNLHNVKNIIRTNNNIWTKSAFFDDSKPTILLNSHHDTVKPSPSYTLDPYTPQIIDGKLFGLGSNDAGGALINLISCFLYFYNKPDLPYNFILVCSSEEEVSGQNGILSVVPLLPVCEFAIVGEPTSMEISVAENGLLVLDCTARGVTGHAARNTGVNAIYKAIEDINYLKNHQFLHGRSPWLGDVKCTVTGVNAGSLHNVVPDLCKFTVDIRFTELYTHQQIFDEILSGMPNKDTEVVPRAFKICPSHIDVNHPFVKLASENGFKLFGSPTCSDRALLPFPSLKMGPGESDRSHTADEFIFVDQIKDGLQKTLNLSEKFLLG